MDCELKPWKMEYADDLAEAINNKNILNNLRDGIPYPYTVADAEEFISSAMKADKNSTFAFAIICGGRTVGSIGVFRQDNIHFRTAEMGYYIAEPYWGKGIGTSAVASICKMVFENTDIVRIYAEPFAYNIASRRILEKNGFVCEGILRNNAVKNGKILDMMMYSLIK